MQLYICETRTISRVREGLASTTGLEGLRSISHQALLEDLLRIREALTEFRSDFHLRARDGTLLLVRLESLDSDAPAGEAAERDRLRRACLLSVTLKKFEASFLASRPLLCALGWEPVPVDTSFSMVRDGMSRSDGLSRLLGLSRHLQEDLIHLHHALADLDMELIRGPTREGIPLLAELESLAREQNQPKPQLDRIWHLIRDDLPALKAFGTTLTQLRPWLNSLGIDLQPQGAPSSFM